MEAMRRIFTGHVGGIAAGRGFSAVAEEGGVPVGVYAIDWLRPFWTDELHAWLPDLIVDEVHRGRGIGRALLTDALARARAAGAAQVALESGPQRGAAHDLYRSLGFTEPGHTWLLRRDPS
jgi:GNAT superfamily N-acetyltransferase